MGNLAQGFLLRRVGIGAIMCISIAAAAQENGDSLNILQSRGVDQCVDYQALTKYGPWDDRNYELTAADLEYLSPDEDQLRDPLPAFFRVELRKEFPDLRKSGAAQYPRSAVPLFELRYGGLKRDAITLGKSPELLPEKPLTPEEVKSADGDLYLTDRASEKEQVRSNWHTENNKKILNGNSHDSNI